MDEDETLVAYHESGHAVIGYALGAKIESIQLGGEADDWLPERFGDCRVNWGRVDPNADDQRQREILTILAGPVAEMLHTGERYHPALYGPWQADWAQAIQIASALMSDPSDRTRFLEKATVQLHDVISQPACWSAVAALADELLAHEFVESELISEVAGFWLRRA